MSVSQLARRKRALLARRAGTSQALDDAKPTGLNKAVSASLFSEDNSDEETVPITATRIALATSEDVANPKSSEQNTAESRKKSTTPSNATGSSEAKNNAMRKESQIARLLQRRRNNDVYLTAEAAPSSHDDALFRAQLQQCADNAPFSAYHSTPVEGFGESMLRAMGWTGSADLESPDDNLKPRPDRLGLGAKLSNGAPPPLSRKRRRISVVPVNDASQPAQPFDSVVASSDSQPERDDVHPTETSKSPLHNGPSENDTMMGSRENTFPPPER